MRLREIKSWERRLWKQFLVIVGMAHPELASIYEPGWTSVLPAIGEEPFDGKPASDRAA